MTGYTIGIGGDIDVNIEQRLVECDETTPESVARSREMAERYDIGLSEALVAYGGVDPRRVAAESAAQHGLECLAGRTDEVVARLDESLIRLVGRHAAYRIGAVPLSRSGSSLTVITARIGNHAAERFFREEFGVERVVEIVVGAPDIIEVLQRVFGEELISEAERTHVDERATAKRVVTGRQGAIVAGGITALVLALVATPVPVARIVFLALLLGYVTVFAFRFLLGVIGSLDDVIVDVNPHEIAALREDELPTYTILLPMYRESAAVEQLVGAVEAIDYPKHKLDVLLLLEADDDQTRGAFAQTGIPAHWNVLELPRGGPRTKPRACNYGLLFARGEYLVIYDAEDLPDRDQLKKVLAAFAKSSNDTICFQCLLQFYNRSRTLLSRLFTLEHWYWFDSIMPGMSSLDIPIPMGGTSNHFRVGKLRAVGGWDPFNLTEDADLSVRMSVENQRARILRSMTTEEANPRVLNWIRQRTRWMKGYVQTFLVYNRNPFTVIHDLGLKAWLTLLLFVGGTPFVHLSAPVVWGVALAGLFVAPAAVQQLFTPLVVYLAIAGVLFSMFLGIYMHMLAAFRRDDDRLLPVALFTPLYRLLQTVASYRAVAQLVRRPFFWEKTEHLPRGSRNGNGR